MDYNERLISEFNEAKLQIYRLHNIWLDCKTLRESGDLIGWRWKLESAELELSYDAKFVDRQDAKGNEAKSYIIRLEKLNKLIENAQLSKKLLLFYRSLFTKEKLLRELQDVAGKGAKRRTEEEDMDM